MFNLGFVHEFGVGVQKDLQLARRFYQVGGRRGGGSDSAEEG